MFIASLFRPNWQPFVNCLMSSWHFLFLRVWAECVMTHQVPSDGMARSCLLCLCCAPCDCKQRPLVWRAPAVLAHRAERPASVCYFKPQWEYGCRVTAGQCAHNDTGVIFHIWAGQKWGSHIRRNEFWSHGDGTLTVGASRGRLVAFLG